VETTKIIFLLASHNGEGSLWISVPQLRGGWIGLAYLSTVALFIFKSIHFICFLLFINEIFYNVIKKDSKQKK
jgi:hypothetical protein